MTPSELREAIESILKVQTDRSIILTGLYLTPEPTTARQSRP